jgi:hypothetical protein
MASCPVCMAVLVDDSRFCNKCGRNVNSVALPTVIPPPPRQSLTPPQNLPFRHEYRMTMPPFVVAISPKSVGVAILLTFFFGPLGMFYSTVNGAIIMCIMTLVVGFGTFGLGLFLIWPVSIIWGAIAADRYNTQLRNRF